MQNSGFVRSGRTTGNRNRTLLVFIPVFLIGLVGYLLMPRGNLTSYILAHIGALGVLGLLGWVAGFIAMRKGRSFYSALLVAGIAPILLGGCAVFFAGDSMTCGGSISLAAAVLILVASLFLKKRAT